MFAVRRKRPTEKQMKNKAKYRCEPTISITAYV